MFDPPPPRPAGELQSIQSERFVKGLRTRLTVGLKSNCLMENPFTRVRDLSIHAL